jgi:hypothetical protein
MPAHDSGGGLGLHAYSREEREISPAGGLVTLLVPVVSMGASNQAAGLLMCRLADDGGLGPHPL